MGNSKSKMTDNNNLAVAKLNNCPTSPRKMRIVADLVRGKNVDQALDIFRFSQKEASRKSTRKPTRKPIRKPTRKLTRKPKRKPTRKPARRPVVPVYQLYKKDQDQISGATYISDVVFSKYRFLWTSS